MEDIHRKEQNENEAEAKSTVKNEKKQDAGKKQAHKQDKKSTKTTPKKTIIPATPKEAPPGTTPLSAKPAQSTVETIPANIPATLKPQSRRDIFLMLIKLKIEQSKVSTAQSAATAYKAIATTIPLTALPVTGADNMLKSRLRTPLEKIV